MNKLVFLAYVVVTVVVSEVQFGPCRDSGGQAKTPGDSWYQDGCRMVTCGRSPLGELYMDTVGCPKPKVEAPCELSSKPYENYPDCCPVVKCTITEGSNNGPLPYYWNAIGHGRK